MELKHDVYTITNIMILRIVIILLPQFGIRNSA